MSGCLFVRFLVCLYPINVKAETIGPKFCVWRQSFKKNIIKSANFLLVSILYCTKRRCSQINPQFKVEIEDGFSELQKVVSKNFEIPRKQNFNFAKFFIFVLSKRKCWKIEQQLKIEIKDGREAPWYPSISIYKFSLSGCLFHEDLTVLSIFSKILFCWYMHFE